MSRERDIATAEAVVDRNPRLAEDSVRRLLTEHPDDPVSLHLAARLSRAKGDREGALRFARQAVERAPDSDRHAAYLVHVLIDQGLPSPALQLAWRTVEQHPESIPALLALAESQAESGERAQAVATSRRAASIAPQRRDVRHALARHERAAGDRHEARRLYRELLAEDPTDAVARHNLAVTVDRNPAAALATLGSLIAEDPQQSLYIRNVAISWLGLIRRLQIVVIPSFLVARFLVTDDLEQFTRGPGDAAAQPTAVAVLFGLDVVAIAVILLLAHRRLRGRWIASARTAFRVEPISAVWTPMPILAILAIGVAAIVPPGDMILPLLLGGLLAGSGTVLWTIAMRRIRSRR